MNVYIYDDYLNKSKYTRAINRMEIRLTDLGLSGKIIRLSTIKNISGTVKNEIKLGAKTIVAVGNNQTVNKIIGAIIDSDAYSDFHKNTLLGIVPIGDDNSIAASFGIKNEEEACNILLARRIEQIDIGLIGKYYFLNHVSIESSGTTIWVNNCSLTTEDRGQIEIINLLSSPKKKIESSPHDGLLDIYIETKKKDQTLLRAEKIRIENPKHEVLIDDVVAIETPAEIRIMKNKLNIIVGKDRLFE